METVRIQTQIRAVVELRSLDGELSDADSVVFSVKKPDGTQVEINEQDQRWGHQSTGVYTLDITLDVPGVWIINVQAINPTVSSTKHIYVADRYER